MKIIITTTITSLTSFILLSIPLFLFMGQMLVRSGLGEAMFHAAYVLAGRLRGGLALGVIGVCSLIGAMVGIIGAGAFVAFGDGYQGLLPVRKLRGDWWELSEEGTLLRGSESGRAIRLGDVLEVRVERVDTARGRVDLVPPG